MKFDYLVYSAGHNGIIEIWDRSGTSSSYYVFRSLDDLSEAIRKLEAGEISNPEELRESIVEQSKSSGVNYAPAASCLVYDSAKDKIWIEYVHAPVLSAILPNIYPGMKFELTDDEGYWIITLRDGRSYKVSCSTLESNSSLRVGDNVKVFESLYEESQKEE